MPEFYREIYNNKAIDFYLLNNISKWWGRTYTHESPLYSVMNKSLMKSEYNDYETYIRLLYRGLSYNSYRPVYFSK